MKSIDGSETEERQKLNNTVTVWAIISCRFDDEAVDEFGNKTYQQEQRQLYEYAKKYPHTMTAKIVVGGTEPPEYDDEKEIRLQLAEIAHEGMYYYHDQLEALTEVAKVEGIIEAALRRKQSEQNSELKSRVYTQWPEPEQAIRKKRTPMPGDPEWLLMHQHNQTPGKTG